MAFKHLQFHYQQKSPLRIYVISKLPEVQFRRKTRKKGKILHRNSNLSTYIELLPSKCLLKWPTWYMNKQTSL